MRLMSVYIASESAFILSGRSSVTVATPFSVRDFTFIVCRSCIGGGAATFDCAPRTFRRYHGRSEARLRGEQNVGGLPGMHETKILRMPEARVLRPHSTPSLHHV